MTRHDSIAKDQRPILTRASRARASLNFAPPPKSIQKASSHEYLELIRARRHFSPTPQPPSTSKRHPQSSHYIDRNHVSRICLVLPPAHLRQGLPRVVRVCPSMRGWTATVVLDAQERGYTVHLGIMVLASWSCRRRCSLWISAQE